MILTIIQGDKFVFEQDKTAIPNYFVMSGLISKQLNNDGNIRVFNCSDASKALYDFSNAFKSMSGGLVITSFIASLAV